MKINVKILPMIFLAALSVCGNGGSVNDDFYKRKMIENMKQASLWLITEGVRVFSETGRDGIHRKLVDDWGVQLRVDPWVESDRYLALFRIQARGINYDIHSLFRQKVGSDLYEFWVIKVTAAAWSGETDRSAFLVTSTSDPYGNREILKQSDQFLDSLEFGDGRIMPLPLDNLELLYDMQPWLFPRNYNNSKLTDVEVVIDSNGEFQVSEAPTPR